MKRIPCILLLFAFMMAGTSSLFAQTALEGERSTIFDALQRSGLGKGEVVINQSAAIREMVGERMRGANVETTDSLTFLKVQGYRTQVFSGNNQRVSKDEAFRKEKEIKELFPEIPTYVTYNAPFWKLRVGDFRSHEEAYHDAPVDGCFPEIREGNVYRTRRDKNSPKLKRMSEVNEETLRAREALAGHYKEVLGLLGEDVEREGLLKTPERVAKAMQFLTKGYHEDPEAVLRSAMFQEEDYKQMVIVKDIDFFSLCEHHMLPFFGKAHVAYIPKKYITGLSKIPRVVDIFARRLQIQERMTMQIKDCIQRTLDPLGVMVVIEAQHMCMQMRGVEKQNSLTTTSDFTGFFQQAKTREEFMNLIKHNR